MIFSVIDLCDGTFLTCSADCTAKRWSSTTGELLNTFEGHEETVTSAVVLEENIIITGGADSEIRIWNKQTAELLSTAQSTSPIYCLLKLKSKPSSVLSGTQGGDIIEWRTSVNGCSAIGTFEGHRGDIMALCELSDGTFVSGGGDSLLKQWNMKTRNCIMTFNGHWQCVNAIIELRNKTIASCSADSTICIWKVETGKRLKVLEQSDRTKTVYSLVEMSDQTLLSLHPYYIHVWDDKGDCVSVHLLGFSAVSLSLLENGSIVVGDELGGLHVTETWMR